jgi:replication factor A1
MNQQQSAPRSEIVRALNGSKLSEKEIESAVAEYERILGMGANQQEALNAILVKFGSPQAAASIVRQKTIAEVRGDEKSFDLVARVVWLGEREITRDGVQRKMVHGILGDDTGTIPFTCWEPESLPKGVAVGKVLKIHKAYGRTYKEKPQVNMGQYSSVEMGADTDLPPQSARPRKQMRIAEVIASGFNQQILARVLDVEAREVEVDGEAPGTKVKKPILAGTLGDESGKVQFTCWIPGAKIAQGDALRVSGGYVRSWRGLPRLSIDTRDTIEVVEEKDVKLPPREKLGDPVRTSLEAAYRQGGALDALFSGVVVDVRESSGYIMRCPECKRVLQKGACRLHAKQKGVVDLRIKAVLDDGTGACIFVAGKDATEGLIGMTLDDARKQVTESGDPAVVLEAIESKILGRSLEVRGNLTSDEFGFMILGSEARYSTLDAQEEATRLLEEMGA